RVELAQRRHVVELQDLLGDGARIFGVHVDAAGRQRVEHDGGVAEALAVRRAGLAGRDCRLANDLAEDVRLGEALGADGQGRGTCVADRERSREGQQQRTTCPGVHGGDRVIRTPAGSLPVRGRLRHALTGAPTGYQNPRPRSQKEEIMKKFWLAGLFAGAMAVAAGASYADGGPILWFEPLQFATLPDGVRYPEGITAN